MRIMIIEDNPVDLKLTSAVMQVHGDDTASYLDAESALACIRADVPDIILLDLDLQGMSGLQFVRTLRGDSATRHIPVFAITAFPQRFTPVDIMAAGCSAYIVKPISTRSLPDQIHTVARAAARKPP